MSAGFEDMVRLSEYDYLTCKAMEPHFPDEFAVRTAAYHLQQAIEKQLKAMILFNGENPPFTHDIERLVGICSRLGMTFSDTLDEISDTLTLWESKSRYDPFITVSPKKYEKAKSVYHELKETLTMQMNGIQAEDLDEPEETESLDLTL